MAEIREHIADTITSRTGRYTRAAGDRAPAVRTISMRLKCME